MQPVFTIKEAISFGWKKTIENVVFLSTLTLCLFVISFAFSNIKEDVLTTSLFSILNLFISYFTMFTFVKIGFKIFRGEKPDVKDIFTLNWKMFGLYVIGSILSSIISVIGFILLIIPGVYLSVRLSIFAFALIDEDLKPVSALKRSMDLSKGRFWQLFWLTLVLGLLNIVGVIAFGIGVLVTVPLTALAMVYVYEKLKNVSLPAVVAPVPVPKAV